MWEHDERSDRWRASPHLRLMAVWHRKKDARHMAQDGRPHPSHVGLTRGAIASLA